MDIAFQMALENAVLVAVAAPFVWAVSRMARRPALAHAMWLILLVKLIVPPFYRPVISLPKLGAELPAVSVAKPQDVTIRWERPAEVEPAPTPIEGIVLLPPAQVAKAPRLQSRPFSRFLPGAVIAAKVGWACGAAVCLLVAMARIMRFARGLRHANLADAETQNRVARLARGVGLRSAPEVWFMPGVLCPMLWAVGRRPRLLIPSALWERLEWGERDSILLHELAHWRRRDHWVRWIELLATAVYWWHPACWWARRELREAEEQCCDAWVLHATGDFRPYANALLHAVEFVSMRGAMFSNSKPLPALASGMGQFNHLKRRIVMLKNASVARALSPGTLLAALGFSAVVLPLSPMLKGADQPASESRPAAPEIPKAPVAVDATGPFLLDMPGVDTVAIVSADSAPEDELAAARKHIEQLRRQLAEAEARIAVLQARDERKVQGYRVAVDSAPANKREEKLATRIDLDRKEVAAEAHDDSRSFTVIRDANNRTVVTDPASGRIKEIREVPSSVNPAQQAERLDRLETQLRSILKEIEDIRGQSSARDIPTTPARK